MSPYSYKLLYAYMLRATNTATDSDHADAAVMLICFFRTHGAHPTLADCRQEVYLERAALQGNLGLVKQLMETPALAINFARASDLNGAICAAITGNGKFRHRIGKSVMVPVCATSQVDVVRYFLDTGATDLQPDSPGYWTMRQAMLEAPKSDNLLLIDMLIARGATKDHLQLALTTALTLLSSPLGTRRAILSMVQHLLKCGAVVDGDALRRNVSRFAS
jgi:hypothetical protein